MPIYEYECQVCGVRFERKQSVHDDPIQTCPVCGGKVRKLFFPAGIIFKGSGWYKTDHGSSASNRSSDEPSPAAKTEPAKAAPAKSEPAKTESSKTESTTGDSKSTASKSNK